jgi:hypothetical protein
MVGDEKSLDRVDVSVTVEVVTGAGAGLSSMDMTGTFVTSWFVSTPMPPLRAKRLEVLEFLALPIEVYS